jgi:cytochrome P450
MLRYESPAQRFARVLIKDHALHGVEMAAGAKVMILYGSANRDETVFAEPDRFDIDRKPGRHLGFGNGLHFCAGAALARLVARIYFRELLVRLPSLRLCDTGPCEWIHSPTFRSLAGLPVTID